MNKLYYKVWHDLAQRNEPWTRQFARIAQAHPAFWYSTLGTLIAGGIFGICFLGWLIWHVKDYIKTHKNNKPF